MERTADFLDALKARHQLTSDYQLAKLLNVSSSRVANYRMDRSKLDDAIALKVAELLDLEAGYVLACVHAERAKEPRERKAWAELAKRAAAALALLCALPVFNPAPAQAAGAQGQSGDARGSSVYYVKLRMRATWNSSEFLPSVSHIQEAREERKLES